MYKAWLVLVPNQWYNTASQVEVIGYVLRTAVHKGVTNDMKISNCNAGRICFAFRK